MLAAGLAGGMVTASPNTAVAALPAFTPPTGGVAVAVAESQLATLPVNAPVSMTGYDRSAFGPAWEDVDGNGCDTRDDILQRDLTNIILQPGSSCVVATGTLNDPYTGQVINFIRGVGTSAAVQIDHLVALGDAWQTGAQSWDATTRLDFANDPAELLAVDGPANEAKGDADASQWLPANTAFDCTYVELQIAVKAKYRLWITQPEHDAMANVLASCSGAAAITATTTRWFGSDRYATAAMISSQTASPPAPVVFVATGTNFPDALAAGPAAAQLGGPVLLVAPTSIPPATAAELTRLKPARIVVLGGTASISAAVQDNLTAYAPVIDRWAGADRYATAAAVSANTFSPGVTDVFIATGTNFPDALAGAAAAGYLHVPILLVSPTTVPPATAAELTRLGPARITLLGGTGTISTAVQTALGAYTSGQVRRLYGADRYATSAAIAQAVFPSATYAVLATGGNFPDALAGGPAAATLAAPILLSQQACVPDIVVDNLGAASTVTLLGGDNTLGSAVASLLRCSQYTPPTPPAALSCSASMSNPTPAEHATDTVQVVTLPNAAVSATAHYKTTTTTHTGTANSAGTAGIPFDIGSATIGYKVVVDVTVSLAGKTASCSTTFTPT